jgi:hypothetical protein
MAQRAARYPAKRSFHRLQAELSEPFQPGQRRTFQRRVKQWRGEIARQLVLGSGLEAAECADVLVEAQEITRSCIRVAG